MCLLQQQKRQNESQYFKEKFYPPSTFLHGYCMTDSNARSDSRWVLSTGQCPHNSSPWMPVAKKHNESLFYFAVSCGDCLFRILGKLSFTAPDLGYLVMVGSFIVFFHNAVIAREAIVTISLRLTKISPNQNITQELYKDYHLTNNRILHPVSVSMLIVLDICLQQQQNTPINFTTQLCISQCLCLLK